MASSHLFFWLCRSGVWLTGKIWAKTLVFINPLMVTKHQTPTAWLRFVVWSPPEPFPSARPRSSDRTRRAGLWLVEGRHREPLLTSPWRADAHTFVVNAAFLCYTSKLPGAFLLNSLGACLSSWEFSACFRGKWGLQERQLVKETHSLKENTGPGLQPDSAGGRAGSLCVPLRTFCKSQCTQAACAFSHEIWRQTSSCSFLLWTAVLPVALVCRRAEGSEVKSLGLCVPFRTCGCDGACALVLAAPAFNLEEQ